MDRAQTSELWLKGEKVTCGYISEDTRVGTVYKQHCLFATFLHFSLISRNTQVSSFPSGTIKRLLFLLLLFIPPNCFVCAGGVSIHVCHGLHFYPDEQ